jgi:SAM-dependent methyltransferase
MSENIGRRYSITRFAMYNALEEYIRRAGVGGRVLLVSEGTEPAIRRMFPVQATFTVTTYPPVDVADLSMYADGSFDCVVTDQVLEHVRQPWRALAELRRVLVSGGVAINTSCSFNPVHDACDYFRFMPDGFRALHEDLIGPVELSGSWGNRDAIARLLLDEPRIFDVRWDPVLFSRATVSEPAWPWTIWCAARAGETKGQR